MKEGNECIETALKIFKELNDEGHYAEALMTKGVLALRGSDKQLEVCITKLPSIVFVTIETKVPVVKILPLSFFSITTKQWIYVCICLVKITS